MKELNAKQRRFAEEYLVDLNATQAALRAGYSENTAMEQGYQLLQKTSVSQEIQRLQKERSERLQLDVDTVVMTLANVAGADILDYLQTDGGLVTLKDLAALAPEKRSAIAGVKMGKYGIELTLYNRLTALDMLMKHMGGYITSSDIIDRLPESRLNQLMAELLEKLKR